MTSWSDFDVLNSLSKGRNPIVRGLENLEDVGVRPDEVIKPGSIEDPISEGYVLLAGIHGPIRSKEQLLDEYGWAVKSKLDLETTQGAVLGKGEHAILFGTLEWDLTHTRRFGKVDGKSSLGRVITDTESKSTEVNNTLTRGFRGSLVTEIRPQIFPIRLRTGDTVNQVRMTDGKNLNGDALREGYGHGFGVYETDGRLVDESIAIVEDTLAMPMSFNGWETVDEVEQRPIDLRRKDHKISRYFKRIDNTGAQLKISPNKAYILGTTQGVYISPRHSGYLDEFGKDTGKMRAHVTAGFADPNWGGGDDPRDMGYLDRLSKQITELELTSVDTAPFIKSIDDEIKSREGKEKGYVPRRGNIWTLEVVPGDSMILRAGSWMRTRTRVERCGISGPVIRPYGSSSTLGSNYGAQYGAMLGKFFSEDSSLSKASG